MANHLTTTLATLRLLRLAQLQGQAEDMAGFTSQQHSWQAEKTPFQQAIPTHE